jgi:hypothetical protein
VKKVNIRGVHRERHRDYKVGGSGKNTKKRNKVVPFSIPYIPFPLPLL